jgi:hypothetical protein
MYRKSVIDAKEARRRKLVSRIEGAASPSADLR